MAVGRLGDSYNAAAALQLLASRPGRRQGAIGLLLSWRWLAG